MDQVFPVLLLPAQAESLLMPKMMSLGDIFELFAEVVRVLSDLFKAVARAVSQVVATLVAVRLPVFSVRMVPLLGDSSDYYSASSGRGRLRGKRYQFKKLTYHKLMLRLIDVGKVDRAEAMDRLGIVSGRRSSALELFDCVNYMRKKTGLTNLELALTKSSLVLGIPISQR